MEALYSFKQKDRITIVYKEPIPVLGVTGVGFSTSFANTVGLMIAFKLLKRYTGFHLKPLDLSLFNMKDAWNILQCFANYNHRNDHYARHERINDKSVHPKYQSIYHIIFYLINQSTQILIG